MRRYSSSPVTRCSIVTIDHRVLDGFQANAFLTRWIETTERWS